MAISHVVYPLILLLIGRHSIFWLLWIMLLWTLVFEYLFKSLFSIFWCIYLVVELLGHKIILCWTFWGMPKCFPPAAPFYIPVHEGSIPILNNTCYFPCFFYYNHPSRCELVSHCGFLLVILMHTKAGELYCLKRRQNFQQRDKDSGKGKGIFVIFQRKRDFSFLLF